MDVSVILQIVVLVTEPEVAAQVLRLEDPLDIYVSLPRYFLGHESQKFQVKEKESKDRRFGLNKSRIPQFEFLADLEHVRVEWHIEVYILGILLVGRIKGPKVSI